MKKYALFFLLVVLIMFLRLRRSGHLIYGDGNGYYAYAYALYFENNLNFKPIISFYQNFQFNGKKVNRVSWQLNKLSNGNYANPWTIGTAFFWLPSIFIIDLFVKAFHFSLNKFSVIYETGPFITGALLNLAGIYFLEKYLLNFFTRRVVDLTIIAMVFATNILFYAFFEPALSHQPSFFLLAFLLYWSLKFKKNAINYLLLGLISGLLVITRFTNIILLIPIYFFIICKNKFNILLMISLIGFLLGVLPQFISQLMIYGAVFRNPYLTGENGVWSLNLINLLRSLFGTKHGYFLWHPLYLVGIFGLIKKKFQKTIIFLLTFILLWIVVSGWSGVESAGFGERMFYESAVYLSFGIATVFSKMTMNKAILTVTVLCFWNFFILTAFFIF